MRNARLILFPAFLFLTLTYGCAIMNGGSTPSGPTPVSIPSPTPMPSTEVFFFVLPPEGTSPQSKLSLVLLDEVTGFAYNPNPVPMTRMEDGRWQVRLTPPVGSLIHYRYTREAPAAADEIGTTGAPITYRVAHSSAQTQVNDIISAWSDAPYQGQTGRIIGRIFNKESGGGLPEMLVSTAGRNTFTDGEGAFRIEGLPPGLHTLTVFSTDGAYQTAQQGVVIAAQSTTPVELGLLPAQMVQVTFEVTVPADTIPGTSVRIAGSLRQLGNTFGLLTGGLSTSSALMPTLTLVDPTHYLGVVTLYTGADLRYKYTLGNGLWNAERDSKGAFLTRQLIVPDDDIIVADTISTWHSGQQGSLNFSVSVPDSTPVTDLISLQFNPFTWFDPLPMWRLDEDEWFYVLHGPLDFNGSLGYRYCRNLQCSSADDEVSAGPDAVGRPVTTSRVSQDLIDEVIAWKWWDLASEAATVVAPEISPRSDFEVGVAFLPAYHPSWMALNSISMNEVANLGSNSVILTPTWILGQNNPTPLLTFDPAHTPFRDDLKRMGKEAASRNLHVALRPSLLPLTGDTNTWWFTASRDLAWWSGWFEQYRSFALTHARLAQEIGASKLILGGREVAPALPGGTVLDGSPSGVPLNAEDNWRSLVEEIRSIYSGQLAFEIELSQDLQPPPSFIDAFDGVHIYWHAALSDNQDPSVTEMQAAARSLLDEKILSNPLLAGKPIVLSVEYLSVAESASACAREPDGICRNPSEFDQGAIVDPDLALDLIGQSEAINAILLEATPRPEITGFFVQGYNPTVALQDKSASVNGKPAREILWYWYTHLTGQQ
jgi:hypothetical protein